MGAHHRAIAIRRRPRPVVATRNCTSRQWPRPGARFADQYGARVRRTPGRWAPVPRPHPRARMPVCPSVRPTPVPPVVPGFSLQRGQGTRLREEKAKGGGARAALTAPTSPCLPLLENPAGAQRRRFVRRARRARGRGDRMGVARRLSGPSAAPAPGRVRGGGDTSVYGMLVACRPPTRDRSGHRHWWGAGDVYTRACRIVSYRGCARAHAPPGRPRRLPPLLFLGTLL